MAYKRSSWWQKQKRLFMLLDTIAVCIGVIVLIFVSNSLNWSWTGLNKTLWYWMQLLIIPIVLTVGAFLFNRAERRSEQQIALDNQRAATLQIYLDRMSNLLLEKNLRASKPDDEVRSVARSQTLTVVRHLDANRKRAVLQFLYESNLISREEDTCIVSLERAALHGVNLHNAELGGANLNRTSLRDADLRDANLCKVSLCRAKLTAADLSGANLSNADLCEADLGGANLQYASLDQACLSDANLRGANLRGTTITMEQLQKAKSLQGVTMPDGTIHP